MNQMRIALIAAIVIMLALPTFAADSTGAALGQSTHDQFVAAVADLRDAGVPTTLREIYPEPPTGEQNAEPLYAKMAVSAFAQTDDESQGVNVLGPNPTASDWDRARSFLTKQTDLLALAHQAAAMPVCLDPGRAKAKDPAAILFPEFGPMRRAARIIAIESLVMARDGKPIDALRNAQIGFRIADHAYANPTLIGWLVGAVVDSITIRSIENIMAGEQGSAAVVSAADQAIAEGWHPHSMATALGGEVVCGLGEIQNMRSAPSMPTRDEIGDSNEQYAAAFKRATASPAAWSSFLDANGVRLAGIYKEVIADAALPYPAASIDMTKLQDELAADNGDDAVLAHIMCPSYAQAVNKVAQLSASVAVARSEAAVFQWKIAHGQYPGNLQQAMESVPVDPFDLNPIRYRPDGGGFVLYSVGQSGKYAGGSDHSAGETVLRVDASGVMSWR